MPAISGTRLLDEMVVVPFSAFSTAFPSQNQLFSKEPTQTWYRSTPWALTILTIVKSRVSMEVSISHPRLHKSS